MSEQSLALTFGAALTEVVAGGDRFSDADGGRSSRDDEHLVVAWNTEETKSLNYLPHVNHFKWKMCSVPVCRSRTEKLLWTR